MKTKKRQTLKKYRKSHKHLSKSRSKHLSKHRSKHRSKISKIKRKYIGGRKHKNTNKKYSLRKNQKGGNPIKRKNRPCKLLFKKPNTFPEVFCTNIQKISHYYDPNIPDNDDKYKDRQKIGQGAKKTAYLFTVNGKKYISLEPTIGLATELRFHFDILLKYYETQSYNWEFKIPHIYDYHEIGSYIIDYIDCSDGSHCKMTAFADKLTLKPTSANVAAPNANAAPNAVANVAPNANAVANVAASAKWLTEETPFYVEQPKYDELLKQYVQAIFFFTEIVKINPLDVEVCLDKTNLVFFDFGEIRKQPISIKKYIEDYIKTNDNKKSELNAILKQLQPAQQAQQ